VKEKHTLGQPLTAFQARANSPRVLSVREASAYLSISERKLRDEIALGTIKAVRLGSSVLLRLKDIEDFMEANASLSKGE
jgi:excisionase family DNA binding protein